MGKMVTLDQAKRLIKLAREAISAFFSGKEAKVPDAVKKEFGEERGVFVSLYVNEELIGCIGFPEPIMPLYQAVMLAAKRAAFEDPRFPPLTKEQFKDLRVEISVLTKPEVIGVRRPEEYPRNVKIGVDGLMVMDEFGSGLLLPQVAVEWDWDSKRFLEETCKKAGLSPDCWDNMKKNIYKFQAEIFAEEKGKVVKKKL